jgi:hypothetical protein
VNAWEWEAGTASGIAGERRQARRRAAALLRSGKAAEAILREVAVITGGGAMHDRYVPVAGTRQKGRRNGTGIQWMP